MDIKIIKLLGNIIFDELKIIFHWKKIYEIYDLRKIER